MLGVIAPLLALVLSLLGPLWLASRPRFDDMLDGLTFGAVSAAAYAAGETLVAHRGLLGWDRGVGGDAVLWMSIVANAAVVKPVVYGSAGAIAAAAFSGIGAGYDGFTARFAKGAGIAALGLVAYGCGVAALDAAGGSLAGWPGAALGLVWGIVVAVVLIVILRARLQQGVLEAALEAAAGKPSRHEVARARAAASATCRWPRWPCSAARAGRRCGRRRSCASAPT